MAHNRLSAREVASANRRGRHSDGGGLVLQVSRWGTKSWIFRYERNGRERHMGLGALHSLSLAEARDRARSCRQLLLDGIDPVEARRAQRHQERAATAKLVTFGECAAGYIEANHAGWKSPKHADQWRMTLLGVGPKGRPAKNDYCKIIRDLPVDAIDDGLVMKVLQPIWNEKTETANRLRGRIQNVLDRARALKLRSGENPARWIGHLDQLLPKKSQVAPVENYPALPYSQLPEFMADLRRREGYAARALEYTVLTVARTGDTIGGRWSEIDQRDKLWTVPKDRIKGKKGARRRDHIVPLTGQAFAILEALPKDDEYLFPGSNSGEPLSNAAMAAVIDRMNADRVKAGLPKWVDPQQGGREIVPHGFRSSFKDWCTEETEFPNEMSEMALAHSLPDKVEAAYRRGSMRERRRRLMAEWARYCGSGLGSVGRGRKIVPIHG
jgi:integrase